MGLPADDTQAHSAVATELCRLAAEQQQILDATVVDSLGTWQLSVHPDGSITDVPATDLPATSSAETSQTERHAERARSDFSPQAAETSRPPARGARAAARSRLRALIEAGVSSAESPGESARAHELVTASVTSSGLRAPESVEPPTFPAQAKGLAKPTADPAAVPGHFPANTRVVAPWETTRPPRIRVTGEDIPWDNDNEAGMQTVRVRRPKKADLPAQDVPAPVDEQPVESTATPEADSADTVETQDSAPASIAPVAVAGAHDAPAPVTDAEINDAEVDDAAQLEEPAAGDDSAADEALTSRDVNWDPVMNIITAHESATIAAQAHDDEPDGAESDWAGPDNAEPDAAEPDEASHITVETENPGGSEPVESGDLQAEQPAPPNLDETVDPFAAVVRSAGESPLSDADTGASFFGETGAAGLGADAHGAAPFDATPITSGPHGQGPLGAASFEPGAFGVNDSDGFGRSEPPMFDTRHWQPATPFSDMLPRSVADTTLHAKRIVMVANTAGGAGKTPTIVGILGSMATERGGDVILVDLNPTGNLGEYLGIDHQAPLPDLIAWLGENPNPTDEALRQHLAWSAELKAWIVTSRVAVTGPRGDVVAPHVTTEQADRMLDLFTERFAVIGIDSGNDTADPAFMAAARRATTLFVPCDFTPKTVHGAYSTLEDLWALGYQEQSQHAIIVATSAERPNRSYAKHQRNRFTQHGLQIIDIPTDWRIIRRKTTSHLAKRTRAAYKRAAQLTAGQA